MIYMVCYDIRKPKRLKKVAKVLESFGLRIQKSFFQCDISPEQLEILKRKLLTVIDKKRDSLFIYPLCEACSRKALTDGEGELICIENFEII